MPESSRVLDLLLRWEELRDQGSNPTPEQLCADCPDLLDAVRAGIERVRWIDSQLAVEPAGADGVGSSNNSQQPGTGPSAGDETGSHRPAAAPVEPIDLREFLAPPRGDDELGRLAQYRVLQELGRGGMGMVLLAEDSQLLRKAAIKIMLPQHARVSQARERFLREARAAARVHHDHVVGIHQVGEEKGVPFIAMEFLRGSPLDKYLKEKGELSIAEVVRIGREIAEGLGAAHAEGLIHRDIKPANIWLELIPDGFRVKILDFGLAREQLDDSHLTGSGVVVGTPSYMSPEQAAGQPVDQRSDLFSLGVVLYRLTAGKLPFTGPHTLAVLRALAVATPAPVRQLNPAAPLALERVIHCLLEKDTKRRFQSAAEVVVELAAIEKALPADRVGTIRPARGSRVRVAAALAALALVVGGIFAFSDFSRHEADSGAGPGPTPIGSAVERRPGEEVAVEIAPGVWMKFCWIPPGEAQLGAPKAEMEAAYKCARLEKDTDWQCTQAEELRGRFRTTGFWLGKYPVTQEEWETVMGTNASKFLPTTGVIRAAGIADTSRFPADSVSWYDCQIMLRKLNRTVQVAETLGKGQFTLPHENEWEYACRGGLGNQRAFYFGNELNGTLANCDGTRPFGTARAGPFLTRTSVVGSYETIAPHPWGLCDMHGNVFQWCANSLYDGERSVRGGIWFDQPEDARSAARGWYDPKGSFCGLRVCFRPEPAEPFAFSPIGEPTLLISPFSKDSADQARWDWSQYLNVPERKQLDLGKGVRLDLVLIPPGVFRMGSPEMEQERSAERERRHRVIISKPFYMALTETTREQYAAVMEKDPSPLNREKIGADPGHFPVETVSWDDAAAFCTKIGARLPTEAQWEYACRAGTITAFSNGDTLTTDDANFNNPHKTTRKVAGGKPNSFGLFDMHGNVAEWCRDWYADRTDDLDEIDPERTVAPLNGQRVLRGGYWGDTVPACRAAARDFMAPAAKSGGLGFRVVVTLP